MALDTQEIATRVVEDAGGFDEPAETPVEQSQEQQAAAEGGQEAQPEPKEPRSGDQDDLLSELGLKPREDGREHRIPYSRVQKIRENAIRKATESAAAEWQTKVTAAEQRAQQLAEAEAAMQAAVMGDPDAFLGILAEVNPAFARYLQREAAAGPQATASRQAPAEMPQPDVRLSDGSATYSMKGLQALLDWNAAQVEQRLAERYKPFAQTVEQMTQREQQQALAAQSEQRVQSLYTDAQTWPGFKEHEDAIRKAFNEDFKALPVAEALNAAYRKVVLPSLTAERNKVRESVLAELKQQKRSTSVPNAPQSQAQEAGPRSTASVARSVLQRLAAQQS